MIILESIAWLFGIGFVSFWGLWLIYVLVMTLKPHEETIKKFSPLYWFLKGVFVLGFLGDVLWNITFGRILFWIPTDFKGANTDYKGVPLPTLTERLRDIINLKTDINYGSVRYKVAIWICSKLLNPFDEGHCG